MFIIYDMWFLKNRMGGNKILRRFNFGELIYFLTLCFLDMFLTYLISTNKVDFYVGKKMIIYIFFAIVMISFMVIFQFPRIFTTKSSENIALKSLPLILILVLGIISLNNVGNFKHILLNDKIVNINHEYTYNIDNYIKLTKDETIVINEENASILEEIAMHPKKYLGYKIITDGFVCKENLLSNNQFILGKVVMSCCRADSEVFAIAAQYNDIKSLHENQLVKIEGIIDFTKIYDKGKEYTIPLIIVSKLN